MNKIAIITDANQDLGMGHVYQSLTIAKTISEKTSGSVKISFITKSDPEFMRIVHSESYPIQYCSDDNEIYKFLETTQFDRIVIDKLDVSPELASKIKQNLTVKLIILTNLTEANLYADVTVLADIGSNFSNVAKRDEKTGKVEFFGPKYWLLRPEFYKYAEVNKDKKTDQVRNIMLMFGGADPSNLSTYVLDELLRMDETFNIVLVLGAAFSFHSDIQEVIYRNLTSKGKVEVLEKISNVAEIMSQSDVVFASPGLSFFEALAVGTPVLGFHQNEIQRDAYAGFLTTIDKNDIHTLPSIIENSLFIYPDSPFVKALEIGKGKNEIVDEILR